jgi:hypothetical protein
MERHRGGSDAGSGDGDQGGIHENGAVLWAERHVRLPCFISPCRALQRGVGGRL